MCECPSPVRVWVDATAGQRTGVNTAMTHNPGRMCAADTTVEGYSQVTSPPSKMNTSSTKKSPNKMVPNNAICTKRSQRQRNKVSN